MISKLLTILALCFSFCLYAQQENILVSGDFVNTPVLEVIQSLERQSEIEFFYHKPWIDTLEYSGTFTDKPIAEAVDLVISDQAITCYFTGDAAILTYNSPIVSEFPMRDSFKKRQTETVTDSSLPATGLIFQREYKEEISQIDDKYKVYEIGKVGEIAKGQQATIAGYVTDSEESKALGGVYVFVKDVSVAAISNEDGFYTLKLPPGKHVVEYQMVSMKNAFKNVMVFSDGRLDAEMRQDVISLQQVIVNADRDRNIDNAQVGSIKIDVAESKNIPVLLGEKDLIKVATTTSGVQSVGEGAAGINVRGGKADQNLFLLDGATIYNTSHFFGFFSVFNSDAIGSMNLFKGAIPAQYGGRVSSVIDIRSKVPNKDKFSMIGGIGPVTGSLLAEVPLGNANTSLMLGGRATYSDYLLELLGNSELRDNQMSFYDLIGKFHHKFNNGDRLGVTAYRSFDRFQLASDTLLDYTEFSYSNTVLSAYYDKQISSSIDAAFNVAMSKYNYDINYDRLVTQAFNIGFELNEFNGAADFVFYQNDKLQHNFGGAFKRYDIRPGKRDPLGEVSLIAEDQIDSEQAIQQDAYYAVDYEPNEKWNLNAGIRYSIFSNVGPYTAYDYDVGFTNRIDSTTFSEGDIGNTYHGPEWRFSSRYFLNPSTSLKASLSRNRQYVHLLINAASIAPNDVWRLSNENIQPQIADQVSLGIFKNFYKDHVIETSVEVYAKQLQNLLDFKTGTDLQFNKAIETGVLQGPGRSYGLEFNIKKSSGWFTGWLNYTYSRTFIQLEGATPDQTINQGEFFPANYDRPHYLNSVTNYKFTRRFSLAVNMVFASGIPATYPVGKWDFQGTENIYYSDRNEFRLPNYFRLDLGLNIEGNHKMKKLAHSFWTISLYNALGWDNVYSVFFRVEDGEVAGYEMKVFPNPIPTITYNFSF